METHFELDKLSKFKTMDEDAMSLGGSGSGSFVLASHVHFGSDCAECEKERERRLLLELRNSQSEALGQSLFQFPFLGRAAAGADGSVTHRVADLETQDMTTNEMNGNEIVSLHEIPGHERDLHEPVAETHMDTTHEQVERETNKIEEHERIAAADASFSPFEQTVVQLDEKTWAACLREGFKSCKHALLSDLQELCRHVDVVAIEKDALHSVQCALFRPRDPLCFQRDFLAAAQHNEFSFLQNPSTQNLGRVLSEKKLVELLEAMPWARQVALLWIEYTRRVAAADAALVQLELSFLHKALASWAQRLQKVFAKWVLGARDVLETAQSTVAREKERLLKSVEHLCTAFDFSSDFLGSSASSASSAAPDALLRCAQDITTQSMSHAVLLSESTRSHATETASENALQEQDRDTHQDKHLSSSVRRRRPRFSWSGVYDSEGEILSESESNTESDADYDDDASDAESNAYLEDSGSNQKSKHLESDKHSAENKTSSDVKEKEIEGETRDASSLSAASTPSTRKLSESEISAQEQDAAALALFARATEQVRRCVASTCAAQDVSAATHKSLPLPPQIISNAGATRFQQEFEQKHQVFAQWDSETNNAAWHKIQALRAHMELLPATMAKWGSADLFQWVQNECRAQEEEMKEALRPLYESSVAEQRALCRSAAEAQQAVRTQFQETLKTFYDPRLPSDAFEALDATLKHKLESGAAQVRLQIVLEASDSCRIVFETFQAAVRDHLKL